MKTTRKILITVILLSLVLCVILSAAACGQKTSGTSVPVQNNKNEAADGQDAGVDEELSEKKDEEQDTLKAETDLSLQMYDDFLEGNTKVFTEKREFTAYVNPEVGYQSYYGVNDGFTLEELLSLVMQVEDYFYDDSEVESVSYCYLDCGDDGIPELALHVVFSMNSDILTREYVIKQIDGKLQICYQLQSYYRDYNELHNEGGIVSGFGSAGAAVNINREGIIDGNGDFRVICSETTSYFGLQHLDSGFDKAVEKLQSEVPANTVIYKYNFREEEDSRIYCAERKEGSESNGVDFKENTEFFQKVFDEAGIHLYSREEIDQLIQDRKNEVGCTEAIENKKAPEWIKLKIDVNKINGKKEIIVSSVDELIRALGDKTTVILKPGVYNVTDWLEKKIEKGEIGAFISPNGYNDDIAADTSVKVIGYNGFDGEPNLVIAGLKRCKLVSYSLNDPAIIESIASNADVLSFENCSDLSLENLIVRHIDRGNASIGCVLDFSNCSMVMVSNCDLSGAADAAVSVSSGYGISIADSTIRKCRMECVSYDGYISFENCRFSQIGYSQRKFTGNGTSFYNCTDE